MAGRWAAHGGAATRVRVASALAVLPLSGCSVSPSHTIGCAQLPPPSYFSLSLTHGARHGRLLIESLMLNEAAKRCPVNCAGKINSFSRLSGNIGIMV